MSEPCITFKLHALDTNKFSAVDSACNAAGLGFNGYNQLGYARWDLVTGVDIWAFEVQWNILHLLIVGFC